MLPLVRVESNRRALLDEIIVAIDEMIIQIPNTFSVIRTLYRHIKSNIKLLRSGAASIAFVKTVYCIKWMLGIIQEIIKK